MSTVASSSSIMKPDGSVKCSSTKFPLPLHAMDPFQSCEFLRRPSLLAVLHVPERGERFWTATRAVKLRNEIAKILRLPDRTTNFELVYKLEAHPFDS